VSCRAANAGASAIQRLRFPSASNAHANLSPRFETVNSLGNGELITCSSVKFAPDSARQSPAKARLRKRESVDGFSWLLQRGRFNRWLYSTVVCEAQDSNITHERC